MKSTDKKSGAAIAAAVAALILTSAVPMGAHAATKGKCMGANACRGKSDCSTGRGACGGATANSCKGKGYLIMTKAECDKIPGTRFVAK